MNEIILTEGVEYKKFPKTPTPIIIEETFFHSCEIKNTSKD